LRLRLPYERLGDLKRLVHPPLVEMVEETYGDEVEVALEVERRYLEEIEEAVAMFAVRVEDAGT
jgi:hypothetical protein